MLKNLLRVLCAGALGCALAGCPAKPEGGDVTLSQGEGVVKYKGAPFAGATVTFVPEKGPAAIGITDLEGKFKLSTGSMPGVAVGKCKVSISAVEAGQGATVSGPVDMQSKPSTPEDMQKRLAQMNTSQQYSTVRDAGGVQQAKSLIDPKFANADKSGLTAVVDKDASKNKFTFDVQ